MSYIDNISGTFKPNFLDSEVGLITKTAEIPASMGVVDGIYKTVPAGTVFPADDATATGIVFQDVDVTYGDKAGSVMVAGRVLADRLSVTEAAKTALTAAGIVFVDAAEVTR
jgi:hypothetical protein